MVSSGAENNMAKVNVASLPSLWKFSQCIWNHTIILLFCGTSELSSNLLLGFSLHYTISNAMLLYCDHKVLSRINSFRSCLLQEVELPVPIVFQFIRNSY